MAGGMAMDPSAPRKVYKGHLTPYVIFSCIVAASGGALFGYDNGVTGGVVSMPGFLEKFFPSVAAATEAAKDQPGDLYCQYNNQALQWFTSSLFIAGMFASIPAAYTTRHYGRKATMLIAGIFFDIGALLLAASANLVMLYIGRIFLGVGVAFASVAVTLYNSEMAPAHMRGRLNQIFQVVLTLGILVAQSINIGMDHVYPWGWRLSLGLAAMPAIVLTLGGIFLPDTPNSLIERGYLQEGRQVLADIRGISFGDVEEEFNDIVSAVETSKKVKHPWRTIVRPRYRPQLVLAIAATFFQQWTGINTIIFYAPQLFVSLGVGQKEALVATIVTGIVNHFSTYISLFVADHSGRRPLLLQGGCQMLVSLAIIAGVLANTDSGAQLWVPWFILVIVCFFIAAYAWSWGPLGWLYPSEIQPLETRGAGQGIATLVNLMFSFVIGQTYLSMLCKFQWGIFLFFGGFVLAMTFFVYFFMPETKGIPIEEVPFIFKSHWFWKRYANLPDPDALQEQTMRMQMLSDFDYPVSRQSADGLGLQDDYGALADAVEGGAASGSKPSEAHKDAGRMSVEGVNTPEDRKKLMQSRIDSAQFFDEEL